MDCLTEEEMSALLERGLSDERRRSAEAHLATCAACRAILAAGARLHFDSVSSGAGDNPLKPREPLLPPGTQVGRYELRAALGAGAAGVVYEAWDPQLKRAVAVKLLWREAAGRDGPAARARLLAEAETMARLSHPHVVAVYDAGVFVSATGSEEVFIAIELVEGQTLAAWLGTQRRPWREIVSLFLQAGRGLASVHAAGIVHRDFKPHNVLIGNDGRARVSDFGLARNPALAHLAEVPLPTSADPGGVEGVYSDAPSAIAGTPLFMAPEQISGEAVTTQTDQFSYCVALYWALYRRHPFLDNPAQPGGLARFADYLRTAPLRPAPRGLGVPPQIELVLQRGLSRDPGQRFISVDALLNALESAARIPAQWRRAGLWVALPTVTLVLAGLWRWAAVAPGRCGDGIVRGPIEDCDDGNDRDDDGCTSQCLRCEPTSDTRAWSGTGHCYHRHDLPLDWAHASQVCQASGADLVSANGVDESAFLFDFLKDRPQPHWIGLKAGRQGFEWSTGEARRTPSTESWARRQPAATQSACVAASWRPVDAANSHPDSHYWTTEDCKQARPFVCESGGWTVRATDGHAYRVISMPLTWEEARVACLRIGAHLATVADGDELGALATVVTRDAWIGMRQRPPGPPSWVTGEPHAFMAFGPGEPDLPDPERCVVMAPDHRWYDRECHTRSAFVCEVD